MVSNPRSKARLAVVLRKRHRERTSRLARKPKVDLFQAVVAAVALVAALVIGSLSLAGVISMAPAYILLVGAWLVTVLAVAIPKPMWKWGAQHRLSYGVGVSCVAALVFGGIARYEYLNQPRPDRGTAILSLNNIEQIVDPKRDYSTIDADVRNIGNTFSLRPTIILRGKFSHRLLSPKETAAYMNSVLEEVKKFDKGQPNPSQINPQTNAPITLTDPDDNDSIIKITKDDWGDFNNGKAVIYVFEASHYEDLTIQGRGFWEQTTCAWFYESLVLWHNCAPNNVVEIDNSRVSKQ